MTNGYIRRVPTNNISAISSEMPSALRVHFKDGFVIVLHFILIRYNLQRVRTVKEIHMRFYTRVV